MYRFLISFGLFFKFFLHPILCKPFLLELKHVHFTNLSNQTNKEQRIQTMHERRTIDSCESDWVSSDRFDLFLDVIGTLLIINRFNILGDMNCISADKERWRHISSTFITVSPGAAMIMVKYNCI